ncbi:MAG: hypothetical protein AAF337_14060, partial [Pseudomonadota bacterium]
MRRGVVIGLMACNVLVALVTLNWGLGLMQPRPTDVSAPFAAADADLNTSNAALDGQNRARYAAMPLFRKDRAFPAKPQMAIAPVVNASGPPQARGTILSTTHEKWVLLVHPDTQLLQKVALGGQFAGWDVE